MRVIPSYEKKQRGCQYCNDVGHVRNGNQGLRFGCPHDECPYKVLDKYETYEQFMKSEDSRILVTEFFQTIADCYELQSKNASASELYRSACYSMNF